MRNLLAVAFAFIWAAAAPAPLAAQERTVERDQRRHEVATDAEDRIAKTSHVLRAGGREIRYTASTGTLPIRTDDGRVAARMFFVSYARDNQPARTRPIAFLFNGGPGSASIWLHMGSFGPVRVQMAGDGFQPAPPYTLVDNEHSLLDASDVVFVDAMSTGYSRPVAGVDPAQFHGARGDIRAFGEFIRQYLTTFDRWASPKFLIGESYGSIRSAGLARELQSRHGVELNGVVLLSALLSYQNIRPQPQNDLPHIAMVQTYAATAWYHKKLAADLAAKPIDAVVAEARAFAFGEYATALIKGHTLPETDRRAVAAKLARFIGLSPDYILQANLRVPAGHFRRELLRDKRLIVGRLDSRYTATELDAVGESSTFDPSNDALKGAYVALFSDYIKNRLEWTTDLRYPTSGNVRPWNWDEFQNQYMDLTDELRETMSKNPFLDVLVLAGYYDMATPVGGIEYNMWRLGYDPTFVDRIGYKYYEGGHMMYTPPSEHRKLTEDVAAFIRQASGEAGR